MLGLIQEQIDSLLLCEQYLHLCCSVQWEKHSWLACLANDDHRRTLLTLSDWHSLQRLALAFFMACRLSIGRIRIRVRRLCQR